MKRALAIDLGASTGRLMRGVFDGQTIEFAQVHRFSNDPVYVGGTLYWDILRLFFEIKQGMLAAQNAGGFDTAGIDTWGVDFALFDRAGRLLENPVHYRDDRTIDAQEFVYSRISRKALYEKTGIQDNRFNTVFQLAHLAQQRRDLLERADKLLFIPDALGFLLTGEKNWEYTFASTSALLNPYTRSWDRDLMRMLDIPSSLFGDVTMPGKRLGALCPNLQREVNFLGEMISVASHDTGSAVLAVPSLEDDFAYISSGTWSLMGVETKSPVINDQTYAFNLTNEGGYENTIRLLKNIMGLWLIQESRRQWKLEGQDVDFDKITELVKACSPFKCFIDPDDPSLFPTGDMPGRIRALCKKTGQYVPQTIGEVARCIYESLALKYRMVFEQLCSVMGRKYSRLHIVGGGINNTLLCSYTANALGVNVVAGPAESTVVGNLAAQFMSSGDISSLREARAIIVHSTRCVQYEPHSGSEWDDAYARFLKILHNQEGADI